MKGLQQMFSWGGEALSSTTRNQSASQLQMGASQKGEPPHLRGEEAPPWGVEALPQLLEEPPGTQIRAFHYKKYQFINKNIIPLGTRDFHCKEQ